MNIDIDSQEKIVNDAEKRLQKLQDDEQDISRKIEQLQKDLRTNQTDQEAQRRQIETERTKLVELKGKTSATPPVQQ